PYNDFISEGGKLWDRLKAVAEANDCVPHMLQVLNAARKAGLRIFYALHHRYRPGDYETWRYIAPVQKAAWSHKTFEYGTWGGEIRSEFAPQVGDIVALEHWCSSGFANTDLDLQLKKQGIHQLIVIGLIAHTCVEATVRYGAELGYEVTMVKDATASYSDEQMLVVSWNYCHGGRNYKCGRHLPLGAETSALLGALAAQGLRRVATILGHHPDARGP